MVHVTSNHSFHSNTSSRVASSHSRMPKAYTSALSLPLACLITCRQMKDTREDDDDSVARWQPGHEVRSRGRGCLGY